MARQPLTRRTAQKKLDKSIAMMPPNFYTLPYADPDPDPQKNPSITVHPALDPTLDPDKYRCDCTLAFFTPNEDPGTFGNTLSDKFMNHLRDPNASQQFARAMKAKGLTVSAIVIDTPNIQWPQVTVQNYVRNTEGEFAPDGTFYGNDLLDKYGTDGIVWDMETNSTDYAAIATLMKACFLAGIKRNPEYLFVYVTYANRDIDQILNMPIDKDGDAVDQELYSLGFECFSDLITKRGNCSRLETMSYGGTAQELFDEGDTYALNYLAKGDASKLHEMRKFVSIGVAPFLTNPDVAQTVAAGCDPTKEEGFGRFMVWNGSCPAGLTMYKSMVDARLQPLPEELNISQEEAAERQKKSPSKASGNRQGFLASFLSYCKQFYRQLTDNMLKTPSEDKFTETEPASCCATLTEYVTSCFPFFRGAPPKADPDKLSLIYQQPKA